MNKEMFPNMWSLIGGMGAFAAYAMAGKEKPKTIEEWQSEAEKWQKQTEYAQQALLDVSYTLSDSRRMSARLEEEARVTGLATARTIRELTERAEKAEAEAAAGRSREAARAATLQDRTQAAEEEVVKLRARAEAAEAEVLKLRTVLGDPAP